MDGACPAPAACTTGSRRATFQDCLRQAAQVHEQELQQLSAENERLRKELQSLKRERGRPSPTAVAPLEAGDLPDDSRFCRAQAEEPMKDQATRPPLALRSAAVPSDGEPPVLPGAIGPGWAEPAFADALRSLPGQAAAAEAETDAGEAAGPRALEQLSDESSGTDTEQDAGGADRSFPLTVGWSAAKGSQSRRASLTGITRLASRRAAWVAQPEASRSSKYISSPSDPGRAVWDTIGAGLIFWDLWAIPLQQSFNPRDYKLLIAMDWATLMYWSIDIPMTLQVGFVRDGEVVRVPREIMVRYLRTWFCLDLLVVVNDWISNLNVFSGDSHDGTAAGLKFLRVLRLTRLLRLVRVLRLARIVQRLNVFIRTERANIFVNIVKMIVLLVVIVHYVCCVWFLISDSQDSPNTWLKVHNVADEFWDYQYLVAFHWALTQFTPASMHVQPQNFGERMFAVLVVLFGLVGFSYVVGSITGSLGQLRGLSEETQRQFWTVRRFLRENDVSLELSARITRYLEREWEARRKTVQLKDHKIFSLLSEQLRSELCLEIWMPMLRKHALLSELADCQSRCLPRLATAAMELKVFAEGDHVFLEGKARFMHIRVVGDLTYERRNRPPVEVARPCQVFIAEPVLWTPAWAHLGMLTADIYAQLIRLDPERFMSIMAESPTALAAAGRYARRFVRDLRGMSSEQLSDIAEVSVLLRPGRFLHRKASHVPEL